MIFGAIPLAEAEGAILAHGLKAGKLVFKKGRVLAPADIEALAAAAVETVVAARLEDGDVGEDEAAARVAAALMGANLKASAAFTGRCNLFADAPGLAAYDKAAMDRLNLVDEALTIAAVPPFDVVEARQMVATIKVIPFAVPGTALEAFEAAAGHGAPLLRVAPFVATQAGLVQSRLPGTKESILDKTAEAVGGRLERLGSRLAGERRCGHDAKAIAGAIAELQAEDCRLLLVSGASAITDRRDVVPAAVERAGGRIEHLGMPVDPGNLLMLARLDAETPLIGLPGCARSPKRNGFDWVLERLLAGLDVSAGDITAMGAGGLLKEIPDRLLPRTAATDAAGPEEAAARVPRAPRIAAVILAAGQSRRMGKTNKLLAEVDGIPMVARVAQALAASHAGPLVAVVGFEAERVRNSLAGQDVTFVHNPDFADGLSTSLHHGLEALPTDIDGAVICLGDMPRVTADEVNRLIAAFNPAEGRAICVPTHRGKRGNPILWGRRFFAEMGILRGDVGARHLIGEHADEVAEVEMRGDGVLVDVDTPDALVDIAGRGKPRP